MTVTINGTTGYTGPIGAIGDLSTTGNTTLGDASGDTLTVNGSTTTFTQGTANGVLYLNSSKVLTSGSALTFDSSGNFLIGTTTSTAKLTVNGDVGAGNTIISSQAVEINSLGSGNRNAYIDFIGDNTYTDYGLRIIRNNGGANTTSSMIHRGTGNLEFLTSDSAAITFTTNGTERLRIDSSGNLAIGVTNPSGYRLRIVASGAAGVAVTSVGSTAVNPTQDWYDSTNTTEATLSCSSGQIDFGAYSNHPLVFRTNNTERMRISSAGAVTIANYDVLTNNLGTQASYNSYTVMTGGVAYKIGQLPQSAGLYAISMHMDGGLDSGGNTIYWESAWGAVIGAIGGNLYNATGAIAITVNSMYHHLTVAQPTFYIDSDNSAGAYGNQAIYVVFPQYTNVQGMTFYYKRLM